MRSSDYHHMLVQVSTVSTFNYHLRRYPWQLAPIDSIAQYVSKELVQNNIYLNTLNSYSVIRFLLFLT